MTSQGITNPWARSVGLAVLCAATLLFIGLSIVLGATKITVQQAVASIVEYDNSSNEQIIARTTRVPRALIAAAIGASLAIAGAIMQAITRNPLGDPTVLGINAGATLTVVAAITVFGISSMNVLVWLSFSGAALGAAAVFALGSLGRDGLSPLRIVLAGSAMTALFASVTQGMLVMNENGLNDVLFWLTGSIAGRSLENLGTVLPYMAISGILALIICRHLNVLVMGEDAAKGLGQRTLAVKIISCIIIVMLAGSSVAVAGPIGFIGIVVPHICRLFAGMDYRWLIPYSALSGALLLLSADIMARYVIMPQELPVGVMTAVIGTPFFIIIARKGLAK
ncbi:FecCD family ABC transporter permease [Paenibacillus plantiphilus]|uniref:FecCD family ABC transporter permease n=1 Tax=Paenibacillus plantiphilus TaxID=2905650 RepID=UPI001F41A1D5|nr:iron ABC transporter permease [Paenibacillus plantiphilus]